MGSSKIGINNDQKLRKDIKKVAEKVVTKFYSSHDCEEFAPKIALKIIDDDCAKLYLLTAGIAQKYTGKLSLEKIGRILKKIGFSASEIENIKNKFLEYGIIVPSEKGKK